MNLHDFTPLLADRRVLLVALGVTVLTLAWVASRIRKVAKSARPDEPLSNLAMLIGLGWSSEAVWAIARTRLHFPLGLTLLLFVVLESLLVLAMIRAKRSQRDHGHPGRSGRTAWIVASSMALVAATASHSIAEAVLRIAIPLLVTNQWWDGLVGEGRKRQNGSSSWRWTPRRLLLAIGAIEPGERDIATVHRERLTQQMTRLFFKVKHGRPALAELRKARLARLSLAADDAITADVLQRVDRATWFEAKRPATTTATAPPGVPAREAASRKPRRVLHRRALRTLRVTHPQPIIVAAQQMDADPRVTQEIDDAICVMKAGDPGLSHRQIAHLLRTSDAKVGRALRRKQNPSPPPALNGRRPELEGANR
jgi:hypothetical protein